MLSSEITIGIFTFRTYTFLIGLAIAILGGYGVRRTNRGERRRTGDVCLAGLAGGLLLARGEHVALHWQYFQVYPNEILDLRAGGLDWHGAVIGALLGMALMAHWRKIPLAPILDRLAFGVPLIALAAWWGCEIALCAYGAEVTSMVAYPPGFTWEAMDSYGYLAPRFYTQQLGKIISMLLLCLAVWLMRFNRLAGKRLGLLLLLHSLGMVSIGFLRGDYALKIYHLRLDIWLDFAMALFALGLLLSARFTLLLRR